MITDTSQQLQEKKGTPLTIILGLFAIFFISALVGAASGIGVTQAIKRFAFTNSIKTETIAQANFGSVLGEKEFRIAQSASFFDCAKAPYAASPACKSEHPRLHITKATLPDFRQKVTGDYKSDYQDFVSFVDAGFAVDIDSNAGLMSDYHALIFQLGSISGISYTHTMQEYQDRAIEILMKQVNGQIPDTRVEYQNPHNQMTYVVARTYDWMWDKLTAEQRAAVANWLVAQGSTVLQNALDKMKYGGLFSSDYFTTAQPWYIGLAFYNDNIQDQNAQALVDTFNTLMLNGKWLDMQNFVAGHQGGPSEIGRYSFLNDPHHIHTIDAWRTATNENYFAQGTTAADADFIRYLPQYFLYRLRPAEPNIMMKWGQMGASDQLNGDPQLGRFFRMLGGPLKSVDSDMAGLNRWIIKKISVETEPYAMYKFHDILFGDRSLPAKSPTDLNLALTKHFEGIGMVIMRTGFEDIKDTAIAVAAPHYTYGGHDWSDYGMMPFGFSIDKYGPLAISRYVYPLGSSEKRPNMMRFTDPTTVPDGGFAQIVNGATDSRDYVPGSGWDRRGITRLETVDKTGSYDYVYMDITKNYLSNRVKNYTRQYVYLRPQTNTENDYIVIFDRTETTRPDIIKRWEVNMAYNPAINGQETLLREGKWEYTGTDEVVVSNVPSGGVDPYSKKSYPEAHGKLFIKTLSPQSVKIDKVGGPKHEFEDDAGVNYPDASGDQTDYAWMGESGAFYTGTYFINVIPTTPATQDNFLHILQTADANLVSQMTPAVRVDGDTMVGAYIQDDKQGHKIVMFSKTEANQAGVAYSVSASKTIAHLIADLAPAGIYNVLQDGKQIKTATASSAGTISFTSTGGGNFQITSNSLPPTVVASASPLTGNAPLTVNFTATGSDLDGTIKSYSWNFGDNTPNSSQQNPSHTYQINGTYQATVTVTDDSGLSVTSIPITITATLPPQVTASANVTSGKTPLTVNFTAIGQNIVSYLWNFGDNTTSSQQNPTHTYQNSGAYTVTVTGTDSLGKTTTDSLTISVSGTLTTIIVSPNLAFVLPGGTQQFSAIGKDNGGNTVSITPTWAVSGGGTIDAKGLFTAGTTEGAFTVTAADGSIAGTASVTISSSIVNDLIGYWTLDEGSGAVAVDASGNGHDGTISGAAWATGKVGDALDFDGGDYADVAGVEETNNALWRGTGLTISGWVKADTLPSSGNGNVFFDNQNAASSPDSAYRHSIGIRSDRVSFQVNRGNTQHYGFLGVSQTMNVGQWYHLALTAEDSGSDFMIKGYVDGALAGTMTYSGANLSAYPAAKSGSYFARIGATPSNLTPFDGLIDDIRIYNRALTAAEIQTLFNPPAPPPPSQPPNITLQKSADKTEVKQGDTITYTIQYQNTGQGEAKNIIIIDPIPQGTTYIQGTATGNPTFDGVTLTWTIPTLAPSASGSVSFEVRVE
jgi:uncharacterized repeat protein (TIGR01451 family)